MDKNDFEIKKKFFFRFLKENGIYSPYIKYIRCPKTYNCFQRDNKNWTFDKCAEKHGFRFILSMLISWCETKEGHDFWSELNNKYIQKYTENFGYQT